LAVWKPGRFGDSALKILKALLVYAVLVAAVVIAVRYLEGIRVGRIHTDVPSFTQMLNTL